MSLVDDFPEDPFKPSLQYVASSSTPIYLPWGHEAIKLGATLRVSSDKNSKSQLLKKTAFAEDSLQNCKAVFGASSSGRIQQATTNGAANSSSHTAFSFAVHVGGDFLGADVRGSYEKNVAESSTSITTSQNSSYRSGSAAFKDLPRLSDEAAKILLTAAKDPEQAFKEAFGDYYVAAYLIGGSNANQLGANTAFSSVEEGESIEITVKVLFSKIHAGHSSHSKTDTSKIQARLVGYDSMNNWGATECTDAPMPVGIFGFLAGLFGSRMPQIAARAEKEALSTWKATAANTRIQKRFDQVLDDAARNGLDGANLNHRVEKLTRDKGLVEGLELPWARCEELCRAGLVESLLLMPYAGLREYKELLFARWAQLSYLK